MSPEVRATIDRLDPVVADFERLIGALQAKVDDARRLRAELLRLDRKAAHQERRVAEYYRAAAEAAETPHGR